MKRQGWVFSLIALTAALGLAGCGSGSSDSDPGPGEQPPPAGEAITISGAVTDMPIANATVTVTVGGQVFTANAPTDAQGNFTVEIRSSDPGALVVMEAVDPVTGIHFTAVLDDFAGFASEADAGGTVTGKDITNVTTAHYVLSADAADDGSIDTADELDELAGRIDAQAVLQLSAAIKLVVENLDGVTMPDGFDNTQELARAIIAGTSSFLDDVEAAAPGALDRAMDLVVNDGNATIEWNAERVPGVYLHREGFSLYALFADGTGLAASFDREEVLGLQWAVNDEGKLVVVYLADGAERDLVTLLSRHRNLLTVMVEEMSSNGEPLAQEPTTVAYFPFADGFTNDNAAGTYSTLGEPGSVKVLMPSHIGYDLDLTTGVQSGEFIWEVDAAGSLHLIDPTGMLTHKARVVGGADGDGMHLLVSEHDANGAVADLSVITVRHSDEIVSTPDQVVDRDLRLAGNTYAWFGDEEISLFRFRADGALREISERVRPETTELVDRPGGWMMVDDEVVRTWFPGRDDYEDARIVDGLGEDTMLVQTPEDVAAGTERPVTRIVPIEIGDVAGVYYFTDDNGTILNEYVQMNMDFTGALYVEGLLDREFEWSIDEHGSLIVELHSDASFARETLTLYMLAGSDVGGNMSFVAVRRLNGRLHRDSDSGRALSVVHIWREG